MTIMDVMLHRGIKYEQDVCQKCNGWGVRTYGQTCTWMGGIGGNMLRSDVCDVCWGSGNSSKPWINLRRLRNILTPDQIKALREAEVKI